MPRENWSGCGEYHPDSSEASFMQVMRADQVAVRCSREVRTRLEHLVERLRWRGQLPAWLGRCFNSHITATGFRYLMSSSRHLRFVLRINIAGGDREEGASLLFPVRCSTRTRTRFSQTYCVPVCSRLCVFVPGLRYYAPLRIETCLSDGNIAALIPHF